MDLEAMLADLRHMATTLLEQIASGRLPDLALLGEFACLLGEYMKRRMRGDFKGWSSGLASKGIRVPVQRKEHGALANAIVRALDSTPPTKPPDAIPLIRLVLGRAMFVQIRQAARRVQFADPQIYLFDISAA